ncbi:MAG: hypothetical protein GYA26_10610 [Flexilinea flocculi]|nr:hypothetical protein [Flexilinea flocculi]
MSEITEFWPSDLTFFLEKLPVEAIYCYDCLTDNPKMHEMIYKFITKWRFIKPFTSGKELKALPYPPGDWISGVLKRLRKAWIDEEISSQDEENKTLTFILPIFVKSLETRSSKNETKDFTS